MEVFLSTIAQKRLNEFVYGFDGSNESNATVLTCVN